MSTANECVIIASTRRPQAPRLTVTVRQDIIDSATKRDSSHCMIAESIKRDVPWASRVSVDLQTIRLTSRERGLRFTYLTPRIGQVALVDFDQGRKPKPFEFRLKNGHVSSVAFGRAATAQEKAAQEKAAAKRKKGLPAPVTAAQRLLLRRASITKPHESSNRAIRIGGQPPPQPVRGRRRAFGLREMER